MEEWMKRTILATASVIALGLAGASPIYAAGNDTMSPTPAAPSTAAPATGTATPAMPRAGATTQPTTTTQPAMPSANGSTNFNQPYAASTTSTGNAIANASRGDIRQAQEKLRQDHLYRGRIDGLVGPEMRQALRQYQRKNGLPVTATLDQSTMNSLLGTNAGQGSSMPPNSSSDMTPPNGAGTSGSSTSNTGQ
jgi:peptidoglycan hydrolase-like protein with peptidoglycan-binding domain